MELTIETICKRGQKFLFLPVFGINDPEELR